MAKQQAARAAKAQKKGKVQPKRPVLAKKPADTGRKQEPRGNVAQRLVAYLRNVRLELKKVIWPKRPEVVSSTVIVLATLIMLAAYVMLLDWISENLVNLVSGVTGSSILPR